MLNLNNKLFEDSNSREAFKEILETLDHINPVFVDRKKFDSMKWRFLLENWEDKFWKFYDLYLPVDLNNKDLFQVVFLLNEKFSLWLDIKKFIWYVRLWTKDLSSEEISNLKKENEEKIERIIFENSLPVDSFSKYQGEIDSSIFSLRKSIREIKGYKNQKNVVDKKEKNKKLKDVDDLDDLIESLYTTEFDLSFFRKSMDMLRYGLMTITRKELEEIKSRPKKEGERISTSEILPEFLDINEKKLREKIWIDDFKKKLEEARKANDKELVIKLEKKATNEIIWILNTKYPYQVSSDHYWYQPNKILRYKELYCVWFSLVWHCFLSELWIKHNWLNIPKHSALEVFIWNDSYYFDATYSRKIHKLKWWKNLEFDGKKWIYKNFSISINGDKNYFIDNEIATSWDPEKILLWHVIYNRWISLKRKWYFDKAMKIFDRLIEIDLGNSDLYYYFKWIYLEEQWNHDEATKNLDKAIELNPKNEYFYIRKWINLYHKNSYNKEIKNYNKAIEINPKIEGAYFCKSVTLRALKKYRESDINKFVHDLFENWKEWVSDHYLILFEKEAKEIIKLFEKQDFEWIRLYVLWIEAESYFNEWRLLFDKWDYSWAIKIYNKIIETNSMNSRAYFEKWQALKKLGKSKESNINLFLYNLLEKKWEGLFINFNLFFINISICNFLESPKNTTFDFNLFYKKEKEEIIKLIKEKNFEWIRLYLLSIENS